VAAAVTLATYPADLTHRSPAAPTTPPRWDRHPADLRWNREGPADYGPLCALTDPTGWLWQASISARPAPRVRFECHHYLHEHTGAPLTLDAERRAYDLVGVPGTHGDAELLEIPIQHALYGAIPVLPEGTRAWLVRMTGRACLGLPPVVDLDGLCTHCGRAASEHRRPGTRRPTGVREHHRLTQAPALDVPAAPGWWLDEAYALLPQL
jgi:hypothetical protein